MHTKTDHTVFKSLWDKFHRLPQIEDIKELKAMIGPKLQEYERVMENYKQEQ